MTSKIVVNNIEADAGVSTVTFGSEISASTFTGNVTGNVTGNLTGNVTSSSTSTFSNGLNVTGGSVGIGTDNPTQKLTVSDVISVKGAPGGSSQVLFSDTDSDYSGRLFYNHTTNALQFFVNSEERFRIDSSGRVGIGTDSVPNYTRLALQGNNTDTGGEAVLRLCMGGTDPSSTESLGSINFSDGGQTSAAHIKGRRDGGTWTSGSSYPTYLEFATTADGLSSPTERLRIGSNGGVSISNAGTFPTSTNETLNIQGQGHNGHGTTNTRSVVNVTGAITDNANAAGLWIGARTNENTAVIGTRTSTGNLAIETYNSGWAERFRIDNVGRVTMPYQPLAVVGKTTAQTSTGNIVFEKVWHNVGSHYNNSTGVFTCPVAGYYYTHIMIMSNGTNHTMDINLHLNGSYTNQLVPYQSGTGSSYNQISGSTIIYCAANDNLRYYVNSGSVYGGTSGRHSSAIFHLVG